MLPFKLCLSWFTNRNGIPMKKIMHAKTVFLIGLVDSAFSGDRPTTISRSWHLAVRRSSVHLGRPREQLDILCRSHPCDARFHLTRPGRSPLTRYILIHVLDSRIEWANTAMADALSHSTGEQLMRQPRGSYAKLICLNCRARKIKCNLPTDVEIEASQRPQPHERSCTRCQQQGLDCVVDKTVLGRPAQKRRRSEQPKGEEGRLAEEGAEDEEELDPNVQDFVLSDLRDEVHDIDEQVTAQARSRPSKREVFESLMDSTHLFSALMARDTNFGSLAVQITDNAAVDVTKLVDKDLVILLDEQ